MKANRCTNFTNLFWHKTLHVSDRETVQNNTVFLLRDKTL